MVPGMWRMVLAGRLADMCPIAELRSALYRWGGLRLGRDVFIGEGVVFDKTNPMCIEIGDRSAVGARCIITAHQVIPTSTNLKRLYPTKTMHVKIEHDVWIMPGVIIVPGVTIGHHSVIATGAVVHKDIPPYSVVVGAGCRIAKTLDPAALADLEP